MTTSGWRNALQRAERLALSSNGVDAAATRATVKTTTTAMDALLGGMLRQRRRNVLASAVLNAAVAAPVIAARTASLSASRLFYTAALHRQASDVAATGSSSAQVDRAAVPLREADSFSREILGTRDLGFLTGNIRKLIQSGHPLLTTVAEYYFAEEGKKLRPLLVLLMAQAVGNPAGISAKHWTLAMTTELIHTASLLHDDVIDEADQRRGRPAVQIAYGNKMAILGGDFLLSRASVALASLENTRVVSLLAQVVGDLVEGEVMQMQKRRAIEDEDDVLQPRDDGRLVVEEGRPSWREVLGSEEGTVSTASLQWLDQQFDTYLRKTYLKTASLMAKSCKASVLLGPATKDLQQQENLADIAYTYGKHLGIAFQITDDLLDFTSSTAQTGKPSGGSDLKLGLVTAPVFYAALEHESLMELVDTRFSNGSSSSGSSSSGSSSLVEGKQDEDLHTTVDIQGLLNTVRNSQGLARTRQLAAWHAKQAQQAAQKLSPSPARDVLLELTKKVVDRTK